MKLTFSSLMLAGLMLAPAVASAELLIYKGSETETVTGEFNAIRYSLKQIYIVDHDTASVGRIVYYTLNGNKRYAASTVTNAHFVTVTGSNNKTYTVVSRVQTDCEVQSGSTSEGVYFAGLNAVIKVNTNATETFPRKFSDSGNGLSYSRQTSQPRLTIGSFTLIFNQTETFRSNQAGETIEVAMDRLRSYVAGLGYHP